MSSERDVNPKPSETETAASLRGPTHSSRIPPSEPGPYVDAARAAGRSRRPTLTGKVIYFGGAGILAAAATAAVVLAARKLTDHGDEPAADRHPPHERPLAPRFAELDEEEREEIRRRARERARADRNRAARLRAMAARERVAPRRNIARDVSETAQNLSGSIHGVMGALTSALSGFRQVATQAGGIMREFSVAADTVRSLLDRGEGRADTRYADRSEARPPQQHQQEAPPRNGGVRVEDEDRQTHDRLHRL
ncbi:hypothetical protein [uncultured Paracoccus sp.]|uniref:hypothetical protein n=1 Tax=uncultured Paracoccus sp. TaxID=189685 RepID=UPI00261E8E3D|nr:hypothetical protein [uncultured Paracoccus sp.]